MWRRGNYALHVRRMCSRFMFIGNRIWIVWMSMKRRRRRKLRKSSKMMLRFKLQVSMIQQKCLKKMKVIKMISCKTKTFKNIWLKQQTAAVFVITSKTCISTQRKNYRNFMLKIVLVTVKTFRWKQKANRGNEKRWIHHRKAPRSFSTFQAV